MLTLLTKIIPEESLRYRINESLHKGTYLWGKWINDKVSSLMKSARISNVYVDFCDDARRPAVTSKTPITYMVDGRPAFMVSDEAYYVSKSPRTLIAYPYEPIPGSFVIWHRRWFDVTKFRSADKIVYIKDMVLNEDALKSYDFWNEVGFWHRKFTSFVYSVLHTIDSCWLCLKYPFLYPRNRWTGKHYNNWKIMDYCTDLKNESVLHARYKVWKDDSRNIRLDKLPEVLTRKINEKYPLTKGKDTVYFFVNSDIEEVVLYDPRNGDTPLIHVGDKDYIFSVKFSWIEIGKYKSASDSTCSFDHDDYVMNYVDYIIDTKKYKKMKLVKWFHDRILASFFFIPTSSEIDAMDDGWFRAFGIQMLDEIKAELKRSNFLYKYRISQIKEKFGELRWYDNAHTDELFNIIQKYSDMSSEICIDCGRPADYITSGYILPLCKKHISPDSIADATDLHAKKEK